MIEMSRPLPPGACVYERFDFDSLMPCDESGAKRLLALGWSKDEFAGKSVLDIGCNSGMLSVHAAKLGAASVRAFDVNGDLVSYLNAVAVRHSLPVTAEVRSFNELDSESETADIVVFMEILQWTVAQGATVEDVVRKLSLLTREVLYIEFPWDGSDVLSDPRISVSSGFVAEYKADRIFASLLRAFKDVQVVQFMRYFGYDHPKSNRVLVRCVNRWPEAPVLQQLGRADVLKILEGESGALRAVLVDTPSGLKVVKRYFVDGLLHQLDPDLREQLFGQLDVLASEVAVLPEAVAGRYVLEGDSHSFSVIPFVGNACDAIVWRKVDDASIHRGDLAKTVGTLLNAAMSWAEVVTKIDPVLISKLQGAGFYRPADATAWRALDQAGLQRADYPSIVEAMAAAAKAVPLSERTFLCHGDIHYDNLIALPSGEPRLIDFDLVCLGTSSVDIVRILVFNNSRDSLVRSVLATMSVVTGLAMTQANIAYGLNMFLVLYLGAIRLVPNAFPALTKFSSGLSSILDAFVEAEGAWVE